MALTGALSGLLGREFGAPVVVAAFAAVVVFLAAAYVDVVRRGTDRGLTSEAAFLITFLLGALSVAHGIIPQGGRRVFTVLGAAVAVTALLSSKPVVQPLIRRLSREDVVSVLKFLIVALLLVPWLPDRDFGPLESLNLRTIGWMMLLVAGVSFVGYAATRLLGPERGLTVTGFVGGLVSSTAVTLAMSSRSKGDPSMERPAALAVVLASSIVFVRVLVVVALVDFELATALAVPMLAMAVVGLGACAFLYRRSAATGARRAPAPQEPGQPLLGLRVRAHLRRRHGRLQAGQPLPGVGGRLRRRARGRHRRHGRHRPLHGRDGRRPGPASRWGRRRSCWPASPTPS